MFRLQQVLLIACLALALSGYTWKGKGKGPRNQHQHKEPPPPYMFLAKQALQKGDTKRAVRTLQAARTCWSKQQKACGFTYSTYRSVEGVLYLSLNKNLEAASALQDSLRLNPKDKTNWFYLGQAQFRLKHYKQAARALQRGRKVGEKIPGYFLLLARSLRLTQQLTNAATVIQQGQTRYPKHVPLVMEEGLITIQLKQYQDVFRVEKRLRTLSKKESLRLVLMTEEALRKDKSNLARLHFLERAQILYPNNVDIMERLAFAYAQTNNPMGAAKWFAQLSNVRPSMAFFAAQFYAQASRYRKAYLYNLLVPNPKKRISQKARFLIEQEEFTKVVAFLKPMFVSASLSASLRYQFAYACLKTGNYKTAETSLRSLRKTRWFRQANRLLKVLGQCKKQPLACQ